jgi:hypothetical protein
MFHKPHVCITSFSAAPEALNTHLFNPHRLYSIYSRLQVDGHPMLLALQGAMDWPAVGI